MRPKHGGYLLLPFHIVTLEHGNNNNLKKNTKWQDKATNGKPLQLNRSVTVAIRSTTREFKEFHAGLCCVPSLHWQSVVSHVSFTRGACDLIGRDQ